MKIETWFDSSLDLTGHCRVCNQPWANIPDENGRYPDELLDHWEVLWDLQPIRLISGGHNEIVLGEWCSVNCFRADIVRLIGARKETGAAA